ncbi:MAG: formate dehydrogenase accessory sulfurtransferase FdhD, partial [Candidatus Thorarchaeota archaeon]
LSSGILSSREAIERFDWTEDQVCKVWVKEDEVDNVRQISEQLNLTREDLLYTRTSLIENQEHHKSTRGFHGAVIIEITSGRWFTCEDIGRHNTVDKVIGYGAEVNYNFSECMVLLSGRLFSNIVSKCGNVGIPLIASMTVATDGGIQVAKDFDMTIVGALSEDGFWLYNEGRVKIHTS